MTGWGEARGACDGAAIRVEIKSVNNRYLDCAVKMPRAYASAEESFKAQVSRLVARGKVDVFVNVDLTKADTTRLTVNLPLARAYFDAAALVASELGLENTLAPQEILRFPDVLVVEKDETGTDALIDAVADTLGRALETFDAQRAREGARLGEDLSRKLDELERLVAAVCARSPKSVADYREKLYARLSEVLRDTTLDESRVLTEAAVFADRVAVDEETVRLSSHIAEARRMLTSGEPVGRRLDFLVQEMNREANTIGSKCGDAETARVTVDLKAEIEKIREQAQNIE
ncbi:MAG: YicC family protein [Oscillospiraceae bacterium]|jgi:uncharacterized protein (TIGR00255 family)|nr:YicC family protein [Oscillospiraceae bacterium]